MATKNRVSGSEYLNNFRNRYLDESELQKPTVAESAAIAQRTQAQLEISLGKRPATTTAQAALALGPTGQTGQFIKYTPAALGPA